MRGDIDFDTFRKTLDTQKISIQQSLTQESNLLQTYSDSTPDFLDAAEITIAQEQRIAWINVLKERQNQIEEAILRIETGKFGICTRCGKEIETDRLNAKPYASYCINCKKRKEKR